MKLRLLVCVAFGRALVLAGCASTGNRGAEKCGLRPEDSTFVSKVPVYRDCAVDVKAKVLNQQDERPNYRPPVSRQSTCYSATLVFVVDTLGRPESNNVQVIQRTNEEMGAALADIVHRLRYTPAILNGAPVRQIVQLKESVGTMTIRSSSPVPPSDEELRRMAPKC